MARKSRYQKRASAKKKREAAKRRTKKRWNRPWRPSPGTPSVVARFMADVGIISPCPEAICKESLRDRFGEHARDYLEASRDDPAAIHAAAAASLDLAVAADSQFAGSRCEAYLSWLVESELPSPKRIVEVGCGIGTNTAFCGRRFPQAKVIGIDRCKASIACAKQLAAKLDLQNVEFHVADALNLPDHLANQRFDLVLSCFTLHEAARLHGKPARTLEETYARPVDGKLAAYARTLSDFLEETGTLVTFEWVHRPTGMAKWGLALQAAGVGIDWQGTEFLSFVKHYGDPPLVFPVLRGEKRRSAMIEPDGLRTVWMKQLGDDEICMIEGDPAEAVFAALHPATFVKGLRIGKDDREMRCELWRHGPLAILYQYETAQHLVLVPQQCGAQLFDFMDPRKEEYASMWAGIGIEEYSSPEKADDDCD